MVRNPHADCDSGKSTGSIDDRDSCAAGRACIASDCEDETRGDRGDCTGGGGRNAYEAREAGAVVHRGIRDRGDACGGVVSGAAETRVGRICKETGYLVWVAAGEIGGWVVLACRMKMRAW